MSEQPGRYQRSAPGLVGALLATVLLIAAFVTLRACSRDNPEVTPTPVDYLSDVGYAQGDQARLVYPATLPAGWTATSDDFGGGSRSTWGLGLLTDEQKFVGLRQQGGSLGTLLKTYVDTQPVRGDTVTIDSSVARQWDTFTDDGGDHAYVTRWDGGWLMVYGDAPTADLERVVGSLTTDPVPKHHPSPSRSG